MRFFLVLLAFCCLLSCKQQKDAPLSTNNLSSFYLNVNEATDTIFTTPKGARISIEKGTFSEAVRLEIKEAYSATDILLGGLVTESNGQPLSSGGMIYINADDKRPVQLLKPIAISLPTDYYDSRMQVYKRAVSDSGINWQINDSMPVLKTDSVLIAGAALFNANCRTCHAIHTNLTGPAMANFTKRGPWSNRVDLYKWIHNPACYIQSDTTKYTFELLQQFGAVMQAFPQLSPAQIDAMVAYVNNESNNPFADRIKDSIKTPMVINNASGAFTQVLFRSPCKGVSDSSNNSAIVADTTVEAISIPMYQFSISALGWYNVDYGRMSANGINFVKLKVKIQNSRNGNVEVYALFPQDRCLVNLYREGGGMYQFDKNNAELPAYLGEPVFILALETKDKNLYCGWKRINITKDQVIELAMKPMSTPEFNSLMKTQKLDSLELDLYQ